MPKPAATFINELALKAGIDANNAELKDILSHADLSKITIPDSLAGTISANLMTVDAAKAHPELTKHFRGSFYDGLDSVLENTMSEMEFDDDVKTEIKKETNSNKRIALIAKKVRELEVKKATATGGDKSALQKTINELNQKISDISNNHKTEIETLRTSHENELTNADVRNLLATYNYALGDIDAGIKVTTAQALLSEAMRSAGVKVIRKDGHPALVKLDGTEFYDSTNTRKDLKAFTEGAISKILKKTEGNPPNTPPGIPPAALPAGHKVNASAIAEIDGQLTP